MPTESHDENAALRPAFAFQAELTLFAHSPMWCNVVRSRKGSGMKAKKREGTTSKTSSAAAVRASISFPVDLYAALEMIAKQKKVSLAWVVREATEQYIGDKWPLFNQKGLSER